MKIEVKNSTFMVGPYQYEYQNSSLVAVKVTKLCEYCNEPVTFTRGGVFSGDPYHWECYRGTPEQVEQANAFQKAVCGNLTPAEYQRKHGVAWNE